MSLKDKLDSWFPTAPAAPRVRRPTREQIEAARRYQEEMDRRRQAEEQAPDEEQQASFAVAEHSDLEYLSAVGHVALHNAANVAHAAADLWRKIDGIKGPPVPARLAILAITEEQGRQNTDS